MMNLAVVKNDEKLTSEGNSNLTNVEILTTEILILKHQTENNLIEIGKRLITVKASLPHGDWGKWLTEKVEFTDRTAQRLMRVAKEFTNPTALSDLSRSKVFALLELPKEEREEFINSTPVDTMSTRQLQQAIRDKKDLESKLQKAEEAIKLAESEREKAKKEAEKEHLEWQKISDSYEQLKTANEKNNENVERLKKELESAKTSGNKDEIERLQKSLETKVQELDSSQEKIKNLEQELKEKPIEVTATPVIEKIPKEVERELIELRRKNQQSEAVSKYTVCFNSLVNGFKDLLGALEGIKDNDTEEFERYKKSLVGLIEKMKESL